MADRKQGLVCLAIGVILAIVIIAIIAVTNNKSSPYTEGLETNQTRTDITACQPNETRVVNRDSVSGNIDFTCVKKTKNGSESYIGLGGGGPRVCDYNQTTEVRGLPNGAGLLACADKPSRSPIQSTTAKTLNGKEEFVNVGMVPGINCTFKQTSPGVDGQFGPQYTCMPVKVNIASQSASAHSPAGWKGYFDKNYKKEKYTPKAYSFKTHSRSNFMGTNYRNNFMGTNYRRKENLGSMSSGETVQQPIGTNRTAGCGTNQRMSTMRRGPNGDLLLECQDIM